MRKIKKPIAFLLVLAVLTLFSGYNGRVKIRDRVIIQGMALDTENDTYFLTVQTYKPSSLQEPKNEYELHTASGSTFYESLQSINSITGQQVFFQTSRLLSFPEASPTRVFPPSSIFSPDIPKYERM